MRQFIYDILKISTLALVICSILELSLLIRYHIASDILQDWHLLESKSAETLIAGNSRAINHCNTEIIKGITDKSTSVIGSTGWGSKLILHKVQVLLSSDPTPRPQILLYLVDPIMLGPPKDEWYAKTRDLKYLLFDQYGLQSLNSNIKGYQALDTYIPLYRYFGDPHRFARDLLGIPDKESFNGYSPRKDEWTGKFEYSGGSWVTHHPTMTNTLSTLKRIQTEYNLEVVLFEPPFSEPSREFTKSTRLLLDSLSPFPFWSWNRGNHLWDDSTLFSNHSHLNEKGSSIFSSQLGDSIASLIESRHHNALQQP